MKTDLQTLFSTVNVNSSTDINQSVLVKLNKNTLANFVSSFVTLMEKNVDLCKSAAVKLDELKSEQINNQKKLLEAQQKQINGVQTVIKTEMKSWTDVVKQNTGPSNQITSNTVKQAVRTVNDEEMRSKNVLIYGLEEKEDESAEDLCRQVRSVYKNAGNLEAPDSTDGYFRVGTKQLGKIRPVKIQMQRTADAKFILNSAHKLKNSDLSSVYVGPDRSKEEQTAHKKLVTEMKKLIEQNPTKHYYIRDNKIRSVDKRLSSADND